MITDLFSALSVSVLTTQLWYCTRALQDVTTGLILLYYILQLYVNPQSHQNKRLFSTHFLKIHTRVIFSYMFPPLVLSSPWGSWECLGIIATCCFRNRYQKWNRSLDLGCKFVLTLFTGCLDGLPLGYEWKQGVHVRCPSNWFSSSTVYWTPRENKWANIQRDVRCWYVLKRQYSRVPGWIVAGWERGGDFR